MSKPRAADDFEAIRARLREIEPVIEIDLIPCAECLVPVETRWIKNGGLLPGDYVLIADFIFHLECWDKKVEAYPLLLAEPTLLIAWCPCGCYNAACSTPCRHVPRALPWSAPDV